MARGERGDVIRSEAAKSDVNSDIPVLRVGNDLRWGTSRNFMGEGLLEGRVHYEE